MSDLMNGITSIGTTPVYESQKAVRSSEDKLSKNAQNYLSDLRSKYGNYDFIVANDTDDKKGLVKQSTNDVSVVFSTSEIERMSRDGKYAAEKLKNVETAVRGGNRIAEEYGATYEKGSVINSSTYSINRMNQGDRAAIVSQMKADAEQRQKQLMNLVQKTLSGQVGAYGKATDNDLWKTLASGNFTVDAVTKAQAQKDIGEDGYWGVKQTSQRLFDFASALAGDDVEQMKKMQAAMDRGFKQATKAWGRELPSISWDTMDAANKLFDDYYKSKESAGTNKKISEEVGE